MSGLPVVRCESVCVRECWSWCWRWCLFYWLGASKESRHENAHQARSFEFFWSFVSDIIEKLSTARVCSLLSVLSQKKVAMFAQRNPPQHQESGYRAKGKTLMIKAASGSV